MRKTVLVLTALVVLAWPVVSCQRTDGTPADRGPLQFETPTLRDAVPLEYGRLVAVTTHEAHPYRSLLWFEQEDQTIVMVPVNVSKGRVQGDVLYIPRR